MTMDKSGNFNYTVDDYSKFCAALGLSSLFMTKYFSQSITTAANTTAHFQPTISVSGYVPVAINGATSNHGSVVLQHVGIAGTVAHIYARNISSSSITSVYGMTILYVKTGFGVS